MESTTNVLIETFDDSDDVSQNSESQVYNLLNNLLVSSRTNIKEQNDQMWDSVFWNDDNYRPDKTTQTMNDIYKKLDKEEKKHLNFLLAHSKMPTQMSEAYLQIFTLVRFMIFFFLFFLFNIFYAKVHAH